MDDTSEEEAKLKPKGTNPPSKLPQESTRIPISLAIQSTLNCYLSDHNSLGISKGHPTLRTIAQQTTESIPRKSERAPIPSSSVAQKKEEGEEEEEEEKDGRSFYTQASEKLNVSVGIKENGNARKVCNCVHPSRVMGANSTKDHSYMEISDNSAASEDVAISVSAAAAQAAASAASAMEQSRDVHSPLTDAASLELALLRRLEQENAELRHRVSW